MCKVFSIFVIITLLFTNTANALDGVIVYDTKHNKDSINLVFLLDILISDEIDNVDQISYLDFDFNRIKDYEYFFIVNNLGNYVEEYFTEEFIGSSKYLILLGDKIKQNIGYIGLPAQKELMQYKDIYYKDLAIEKNGLQISLNEAVEAYPYLKSNNQNVEANYVCGNKKYSILLNKDNRYVINGFSNNDSYIYFLDNILSSILEREHTNQKYYHLNVSNINPFTNQDKLQKVSKMLRENSIPFSFSFTPTHRNKNNDFVTNYSDVDGMVDSIKSVTENGGSLILHGYNDSLSRIESVNMDALSSSDYSNEMIVLENKIKYTLIDLEKEGIYPLAYQFPHSTNKELEVVSEIFSTAYGKLHNRLSKSKMPSIPRIVNNHLFQTYIPSNLGNISNYGSLNAEKENELFAANLYFDNALASFVFDINENINVLRDFINEVSYYPIKPLDLYQMNHSIIIDEYKVIIEDNQIKSYTNFDTDKPSIVYELFSRISFFLVLIGVITVIAFIAIYKSTKEKKKQKVVKRRNENEFDNS